MAANLDLFRMRLHRQPNAKTKLDLRSPIVDRENRRIEDTNDGSENLKLCSVY